jgi:hypothetical protein
MVSWEVITMVFTGTVISTRMDLRSKLILWMICRTSISGSHSWSYQNHCDDKVELFLKHFEFLRILYNAVSSLFPSSSTLYFYSVVVLNWNLCANLCVRSFTSGCLVIQLRSAFWKYFNPAILSSLWTSVIVDCNIFTLSAYFVRINVFSLTLIITQPKLNKLKGFYNFTSKSRNFCEPIEQKRLLQCQAPLTFCCGLTEWGGAATVDLMPSLTSFHHV